MPTYEYHCEKCKKNFDAFQSMKDQAWDICPEKLCRKKTWGKGKVKRLLGTGAGLIFKGSGFYTTDYRSAGYKEAAKKDASNSKDASSSKDAAGSKPSSGGDAKTAAPAPEKAKPAASKPPAK